MSNVEELVIKVVMSETVEKRAEALAMLKDAVVTPLNNTISKQTDQIKAQEIALVENSEEIHKLNKKITATKKELEVAEQKNIMVDEHLDFYKAFTILEVNTKFGIPSGKLMKWCKRNKYVAALKVEVFETGAEYFTVINKGGFPSIGVTPSGVKLIQDNLTEIIG